MAFLLDIPRMQMPSFARYCSLLVAVGLWTPAPGSAQVVDRPRDDGVLRVPDVTIDVPRIGGPTSADLAPPAQGSREAPKLTDEDLKSNPNRATFVLGKAVQIRDWRTVRHVLGYYADIPGHDPLALLYAKGALDRQEGRHRPAIAAYREMVERDATLQYVRLDLAAMLFEDKQYSDARRLFQILRRDPDLSPSARQAVEQYLAALGRLDRWHGTARIGYKYNDNVNQGSAERYIELLGQEFEKNPALLPHSANAINYFANLNRDFSITGNHVFSVDATVEGDHYWDDRDWRETTVTLRGGYKYRDLKSWLSVLPSYSQLWLGGDPYRRTVGASIEYGRWIDRKWQIIGSYSYFNKKFDRPGLSVYNGDLHALAATAVYLQSPNTIFYGGLTIQRDLLETRSESSSRDGASLGFIKVWNSGLVSRGNVRYSYRRFHDYSFWDRSTIRRDHEYQVDLSLTHNQLRFAGIYPRLNYQYLRVDSSVPAIFSRKGNQITFSLETTF